MRIAALVASASVFVLLAGSAVAENSESLATRYGTLTFRVSATRADLFEVFLGHELIINVEAIGLSLHHVKSRGRTEYALVVSHVSGLNCRQELRVVELKADNSHLVTKAFGSCTELVSVSHSGKNLIVETVGPFTQGRPGEHHKFKISNGQVISQR